MIKRELNIFRKKINFKEWIGEDIDQIKKRIKEIDYQGWNRSKELHSSFKNIIEKIKDDYHNFITAEITRLSKYAGRKNPPIDVLIFYCSLIEKNKIFDSNDVIVRKILQLPPQIYPKNNLDLEIDDKATYWDITKIKYKYSNIVSQS